MARHSFDVTEGPLLKKTILFAIPIILTSLLQLLFNAADLMVVGTVDEVYVGAVGATGAVTNLLVNLFIGLSGGIGVVVAQKLGARDYGGVHKVVHTAIPLAVISGAILTVVGFFYTEPMLELMETPKEIEGLAATYMKIYYCGMIPNLLYNFGASILRSAGDTKGPLYYLTIAGIVNVLLNFLFVKGFGMNVDGVALATIISQSVSAVLVILSLAKRVDAIRFDFRAIHIDGESLKSIVKIGVPAGLQSSMYSIANIIIQSSVNGFGAISVTGNSAAINIEGFAYVVLNAFYQSAMTFAGQNLGAGKFKRLNKVFATNILCVVIAGLGVGLIFNLFLPQLLSLYSVTNPEAVEFAKIRMLFVTLPYFLCGALDVTTGIMRGIGSSLVPMIISVLGVCVLRLGWIYTVFAQLPYGQDDEKKAIILFLIYPISWIITFGAELIAYIVVRKVRQKRGLELSEEQ